MFKIDELVLEDFENHSYTYSFSEGINYFVGSNNTGKSEFYKFIDFMFGSSMNMKNYDWYRDTLKKATMKMTVNGVVYWITRTEHPEENYFKIEGDTETESIGLTEYKEKLNEIFAYDEVALRRLREFVEENMSYRVFTMFNFLGEKGQGLIRDFLDKCRDIKYSVKLAPVLNYIFNDNIKRIAEIKKEIEEVKERIRELEVKNDSFSFAQRQINNNLLKLNCNVVFNGHNGEEIQKEVSKIMRMDVEQPKRLRRSVSELEVIYSNLTEQIKVYENTIKNYRQNEKENQNRKLLLSNLQVLVENETNMEYLVKPLSDLINELEGSIAFGKYIISDETIKELKRQREQVKAEMQKQSAGFKCYSLEEKTKAVALIQAYLQEEIKDVSAELNEYKKELKQLKNELQELQNSDNSKKVDEFSKVVTRLYRSGENNSEIIRKDFGRESFRIAYLKRGNILQPVEKKLDTDKENDNLYLGSMARHTLIQLSGYLAFLNILIKGNKCPIIPVLVIDHLSKPFSDDNKNAVGKILEEFYKIVSKRDVQIFMFDDKDPALLGIIPDHCEHLRNEVKTGFNPFYRDN